MPITKRVFNLTREQLERAPTELLDALLSLEPTPAAELSIETILNILDVIEERICENCGQKMVGGSYTAPWENGNNPDGYVKCPHRVFEVCGLEKRLQCLRDAALARHVKGIARADLVEREVDLIV